MTDDDFVRWWRDFSEAFPAVHDWVKKTGGENLIGRWRDAIAKAELADALIVTQKLLAEQGAGRFPSDWQDIPSTVNTMCKLVALDRKPAEEPNWRRNCFKCRICQDTGVVIVWHHKAIEFVCAGKEITPGCGCNHLSAATQCQCQPVTENSEMLRFDDESFCRLAGHPLDLAQQKILKDWITYRSQEYWNAKRHTAFDRFNAEGSAS